MNNQPVASECFLSDDTYSSTLLFFLRRSVGWRRRTHRNQLQSQQAAEREAVPEREGGGDNTAVLLSRFQATSKPTVSHTFYWLLPNCIMGCKWGTGLWIVACCQTLEKNLLNNAVRPPLMSTRLLIQFPLCCKMAQWVWQRKVHQKKKLTFN